MFKLKPVIAACGALLLCAASGQALAIPERAAETPEQLLAQLRSNTGGQFIDTVIDRAGYRILHSRGSQPLLQDDHSDTPVQRAQNFLSIYGPLLGVKDALADLRVARSSNDGAGNTHIHMNQVFNGVPVLGARLVVHMNKAGVTGVNGVFVKNLEGTRTEPKIAQDDAGSLAVTLARKRYADSDGKLDMHVESSRLVVYRSDILSKRQAQARNYLAYEVVVSGYRGSGVRERYILDADTGAPINRIDGVQELLNREIHTPDPTTPPVLTEGSALAPADPPLINDDRSVVSSRVPPVPPGPLSNLYIFAGGTYALYKNMFGREGFDEGYIDPATGMVRPQVQHSTLLVNEICPNAYWDGFGTNYCPAFDADDVVSHEWSHAYSEYTHGLYYQWQSGALNESYSDIYGETYDLVNGIEGPLGITLAEGDYYENRGSRWLVGEDLSEPAALLLLRDMWDPDNYPNPLAPQPGSVISSANYDCGAGVHNNSGVPNHAYAMLVDGKEYNGHTIAAIGMVKAARIYFQAETHYQIPTTDFAQHADALEQSCHDLIGADLYDPTGALSAEKITAADCDAVHEATEATEMRISDKERCGYTGRLLIPEDETPAICGDGLYEYPDFAEAWKTSALPAGWTITQNETGDASYFPTWELTDQLPAPHTGYAMYRVDYNHGGFPTTGNDVSSSSRLDSPEITLAEDQSYLKFAHYMASEGPVDGGNIKVSINGGDFTIIPGSAIIHNTYTGPLMGPPLIPGRPPIDPTGVIGANTNPMADEEAWTGTDQGEAVGEWGISIVDLAALGLHKGDKVRLRWEFGNDYASGGGAGWYLDDLSVLHCSATPPPDADDEDDGEEPPVTPPVIAETTVRRSRFGGALGLWLLLPLMGAAALRRKRIG